MKKTTATAFDIVPVQMCIHEEELIEYTNQIKERGYFPIACVEISGKYVIGDGHHTSSSLFLMSEPIELKVLENDEDIYECRRGVFCRLNSMEDFFRNYEQWSENRKGFNITGIWDLLVLEDDEPMSKERSKRVKDYSLKQILRK